MGVHTESTMADRKENTRKEASPSREGQEIPVMHEVGESSRPPQFVPPAGWFSKSASKNSA